MITQDSKVVPHDPTSHSNPSNMMTASWIKPKRRPTLFRLADDSLDVFKYYSPITNCTNKNLTDHDTRNFKVSDWMHPGLATRLVWFPACWPYRLIKRCKVADREQDVSFAWSVQLSRKSLRVKNQLTLQDQDRHLVKQHSWNTTLQDWRNSPSSCFSCYSIPSWSQLCQQHWRTWRVDHRVNRPSILLLECRSHLGREPRERSLFHLRVDERLMGKIFSLSYHLTRCHHARRFEPPCWLLNLKNIPDKKITKSGDWMSCCLDWIETGIVNCCILRCWVDVFQEKREQWPEI